MTDEGSTNKEELPDGTPAQNQPLTKRPGFGWTVLFSGAAFLFALIKICIWLQLLNQQVLILLAAITLIWAVVSIYFIEMNCTHWARRR